jgi:N-acetylglucosamine kinase-like BadF-type ATPase
VEEERQAGDAVAARLFAEAAYELSSLVVSVYERFNASVQVNKIALSGGLLDSNEELSKLTGEQLSIRCPGLAVARRIASAEEGACILARAGMA